MILAGDRVIGCHIPEAFVVHVHQLCILLPRLRMKEFVPCVKRSLGNRLRPSCASIQVDLTLTCH